MSRHLIRLPVWLSDDSSDDDVGFVGDTELIYPLERYRGVTFGGFRRKMEQRSEFGHVDTNVLSLDGWMKYSTFPWTTVSSSLASSMMGRT